MATTTNFQLRYPLSSGTVNVPGDIQNLAVDADLTLSIIANSDVFNSVGGCTLTTTSASYVDIVNATKSFTKIGGAADSDLIVTCSLSGFVTVGTTEFAVGSNVNGTDRDMTKLNFNTANAHGALPSGTVRITGLAAGTYTVKLRAKRNSGTGVLTIDAGDSVMFSMQERALFP